MAVRTAWVRGGGGLLAASTAQSDLAFATYVLTVCCVLARDTTHVSVRDVVESLETLLARRLKGLVKEQAQLDEW